MIISSARGLAVLFNQRKILVYSYSVNKDFIVERNYLIKEEKICE
jgi:hypothetical protein